MRRTTRTLARGPTARGPTTHGPTTADLRNGTIVVLVTILALFATISSARADVLIGTTDGSSVLAGSP